MDKNSNIFWEIVKKINIFLSSIDDCIRQISIWIVISDSIDKSDSLKFENFFGFLQKRCLLNVIIINCVKIDEELKNDPVINDCIKLFNELNKLDIDDYVDKVCLV